MGLKAGPYETAKDARTALSEAGYIITHVYGSRPQKWVHLTKSAKWAVQILRSGRAKIVPYPNLKRLDYRTTSDAERAGKGYR
jgi:hypothetical protein